MNRIFAYSYSYESSESSSSYERGLKSRVMKDKHRYGKNSNPRRHWFYKYNTLHRPLVRFHTDRRFFSIEICRVGLTGKVMCLSRI